LARKIVSKLTYDVLSGMLVLTVSVTVTTCLENLEMSGNLTAVGEMSGILLKVGGKILSGKIYLKLFIGSCIFASIQVKLLFLLFPNNYYY